MLLLSFNTYSFTSFWWQQSLHPAKPMESMEPQGLETSKLYKEQTKNTSATDEIAAQGRVVVAISPQETDATVRTGSGNRSYFTQLPVLKKNIKEDSAAKNKFQRRQAEPTREARRASYGRRTAIFLLKLPDSDSEVIRLHEGKSAASDHIPHVMARSGLQRLYTRLQNWRWHATIKKVATKNKSHGGHTNATQNAVWLVVMTRIKLSGQTISL